MYIYIYKFYIYNIYNIYIYIYYLLISITVMSPQSHCGDEDMYIYILCYFNFHVIINSCKYE